MAAPAANATASAAALPVGGSSGVSKETEAKGGPLGTWPGAPTSRPRVGEVRA